MSTTSSERRLHPISLVFDILRHIPRMIFAVIIVSAGEGRAKMEWILFAVLGLSLIAAAVRYFTFRYTFEPRELVLRWGILIKHERHIPYDRIQNIDAIHTLLHRIFGMVTVSIQTGSGGQAEGKLAVVTEDALEEIRGRVFGVRDRSPTDDTMTVARPAPTRAAAATTLLHLTPGELFLSGIIEGRGSAVLAAILALVAQASDVWAKIGSRFPGVREWFDRTSMSVPEPDSPLVIAGAIVVGFVLLMILLRIASAIRMVVHFFDFRVTKLGDDLRVEHGLLTRIVNTIPLRRIQWVVVDESVLHRLFGRVAVRVTTAGGTQGEGKEVVADREWLAPILRRAELAALLNAVQPGLSLDVPLQRPHPRGFMRAMTPPTVVALLLSAGAAPFIGWWSLAIVATIELWALARATLLIRNLGWASTDTSVIFRGGVLRRHTAATRFSRLQTVTLLESPFDRGTRMASVRVDTAGAAGAHLEVRYLPREDAATLTDLLRLRAFETSFVW